MTEIPAPKPFAPNPPDAAGIVSWIHIGDLHMTRAGAQNDLDLQAIVQQINTLFAASISFVFLPGDVADDGSTSAYAVVRKSLDTLQAPWCAIVGDHDVHERSFSNFLAAMSPRTHFAFTVGDLRFVAMNAFDVPDPGAFVVSDDQLTWLKRELQTAASRGQRTIVLLHCYPSDLKLNASALAEIIHNFGVTMVDMGHTHYNEIANDGCVLYTATRSTGQIEEGPVGFSITNLDQGNISWRFIELGTLPAVIITSPTDARLRTVTSPTIAPDIHVRAKAWSRTDIVAMTAHLGSQTSPMQRIPSSQVWQTKLPTHSLQEENPTVRVTLEDSDGNTASDEIRIALIETTQPPRSNRDQDNALDAWQEHGLLGTQLGPNKNGKKW